MTRSNLFASFFLLLGSSLLAQKAITLEDIWKKYTFNAKSVPGFNFMADGKSYSRLDRGGKVIQYDLSTGSSVQVIFDPATAGNLAVESYTFSDNEQKLLLATATEQIYRHSSKSTYYMYDRGSKQVTPLLNEGKVMYATFNPQADKVAFVFNNNLYVKELTSGKSTQITKDGQMNAIINGAVDWVYEEEFSMDRGFEWSPDGARIAFFRFDEQKVPQFTMTNFEGGMHPSYVNFKYPKVGEANSQVKVHIYDLASGQTTKVTTPENNEYIPRIKWTQDPRQLCVFLLNRHQNKLELVLADAGTGQTRSLLKEDNKYYVDLHDNLRFLKDGQRFVWTSEMDGWNHIYLYDLQGNKLKQVTSGQWEVSNVYGVDEKNNLIYYQAGEGSHLERQVYQIGLDGSNKKAIAANKGWNNAQFSSTYDYYVIDHATANTPPTYTVFARSGAQVRMIEDNAALRQLQKDYGVQPVEFFKFSARGNTELYGWNIKPANFDPTKRYPVLMFLYGGPGSQEVKETWRGQNYWWFQYLAQQGYLIACVDNRGTGGRGEEFKKMTYLQLGKYETEDQLEAARYLGKLRYADPARIGIFGWSYGGFMSSNCLFKGEGVLKAAIAVAPVTNWKWYDNIYTERYMRTVDENPNGYQLNSPINFTEKLNGNYLLVHGMGDDNVHFQHTAELVNALVESDKQFDTYFYPNRNHGIYGGNTRFHLYKKMTDFLNEKLKGVEVAPPTKAVDVLNRDALNMKEQVRRKKKLNEVPPIKQ
jgi:dipeptidyl-peptidase-4